MLGSYLVGALLVGALTVLILKFLKLAVNYKKYLDVLRTFPSDPGNLIFGHLFMFPGPNEEGLAFQREMTKKYPRLSLAWLTQFPMVNVYHPDTIKSILKSSEPKCVRTYNLLTPWIGDGLLTTGGAKWARNRRLLTPAFHFEILKNYVELKNRCTDVLLQKMVKSSKEDKSWNVFANISLFTLDVIIRCAMSYETDCQNVGEKHPYVQAVNRIIELIVIRFFQPWFHGDFPYFITPKGRELLRHCKLVHDVAEQIIAKRRTLLKNQGSTNPSAGGSRKCMDFLDTLLSARDENGRGLTNLEIRDEVDTFLFEGHDTTSSAISWTLFALAENQDIQKRVQKELDGLFLGRENKDVLWDDLANLPYLSMVIKEAMRIYSPVPFIQREMTKDMEVDGRVIPAGTMTSVILYNLHHNPEIWPDSLKFDPDRFLPENVEKRSAYAFVPFSAGPRNCIGQTFAMDEIKILLAKVLFRFNLEVDLDHKVEKLETVVMKAKNDVKLFITPRHCTQQETQ